MGSVGTKSQSKPPCEASNHTTKQNFENNQPIENANTKANEVTVNTAVDLQPPDSSTFTHHHIDRHHDLLHITGNQYIIIRRKERGHGIRL